MKKIILFCFLLAACGKGSPQGTTWTGGLFAVYQPLNPVCIVILHQGHAAFDDPDYGLVSDAETFSDHGCIVYGFEMPPGPHDSGPMEKYYQPVIDLLNTFNTNLPVYMVGFSGGGWTTTWVTAMDNRIVKGYSVDGDPAYDYNHWEQINSDYFMLYALAGDRLLHINVTIDYTGDNYYFVKDTTVSRHYFSPWALEYILKDMGI